MGNIVCRQTYYHPRDKPDPELLWRFLNNLMTLISCESLKEIGEVACVTPARSSHGQTLLTCTITTKAK